MFINTINPIAFELGFLTIRWYGIFLGLGVGLGLLTLVTIARRQMETTTTPPALRSAELRSGTASPSLEKGGGRSPDELLSIALWLIIGGLIGARIGHILFYNLNHFLSNPIEIIMINHGGLSSHGMALGLILAFLVYIKIKATTPDPSLGRRGYFLAWRDIIDLLVIPIPLIAGFIRIGNYFNSEIVGRASDLPWAVQFPLYESNPIFRHPSQIYEALIAFAVFGILLLIRYRYPLLPKEGSGVVAYQLTPPSLTFIFIFLYFTTRFLIEFVKEYPTYFHLTIGQWLSVPFIFFSTIWLTNKFLRNK